MRPAHNHWDQEPNQPVV